MDQLTPRWIIAWGVIGLWAAGCASIRPAPVTERAPQSRPAAPRIAAKPRPPAPGARADVYTVKPGDTLYSIALDHGLDYRDLASWNDIDAARIHAGQQLRLTPPPAATVTAPLKTTPGFIQAQPLGSSASPAGQGSGDNLRTEPKAVRVPYSDEAYAQMASVKPGLAPASPSAVPGPLPEPAKNGDDLDWGWPAVGKIVTPFNDSTSKGIAIAGKLGQPVLASAGGKVIFSGTGIRGFGKLIVIKHNKTFLSVYAHNSVLLVKEGQTVAKGQKIAEMGNTDSDRVELHFEIRRLGKPVDPVKLLPEPHA